MKLKHFITKFVIILVLCACQPEHVSQIDFGETSTISPETLIDIQIDILTQITTGSSSITSTTISNSEASNESDLGVLLLQIDFNDDGINESIYHYHDKNTLTIEINENYFDIPVVKYLYYFETSDQNSKQYGFSYYTNNDGNVNLSVVYVGGFDNEDWLSIYNIASHYDYRRISYSIFNATANKKLFDYAIFDIDGFLYDKYAAEIKGVYKLIDYTENDIVHELNINNNKLEFISLYSDEVYIANDKFMLKSFVPELVTIYSRKRIYADERDALLYDEDEYLIKVQKETEEINFIYLGTAGENFISPYGFYEEIIDDNELEEQGWDLVDEIAY
jgi:hypothetical protein